MKDPNIIRLSPEWLRSLNECQSSNDGKHYVPARAEGYSSILYRLRAAWLVWTGRADALVWPQGQ